MVKLKKINRLYWRVWAILVVLLLVLLYVVFAITEGVAGLQSAITAVIVAFSVMVAAVLVVTVRLVLSELRSLRADSVELRAIRDKVMILCTLVKAMGFEGIDGRLIVRDGDKCLISIVSLTLIKEYATTITIGLNKGKG